jgi:hypothetical protein
MSQGVEPGMISFSCAGGYFLLDCTVFAHWANGWSGESEHGLMMDYDRIILEGPCADHFFGILALRTQSRRLIRLTSTTRTHKLNSTHTSQDTDYSTLTKGWRIDTIGCFFLDDHYDDDDHAAQSF